MNKRRSWLLFDFLLNYLEKSPPLRAKQKEKMLQAWVDESNDFICSRIENDQDIQCMISVLFHNDIYLKEKQNLEWKNSQL